MANWGSGIGARAYARAYMRTYTCSCAHTRAYMCVRAHVHARIRARTCAYVHMYMRTRMRVRVHMCACACICTSLTHVSELTWDSFTLLDTDLSGHRDKRARQKSRLLKIGGGGGFPRGVSPLEITLLFDGQIVAKYVRKGGPIYIYAHRYISQGFDLFGVGVKNRVS